MWNAASLHTCIGCIDPHIYRLYCTDGPYAASGLAKKRLEKAAGFCTQQRAILGTALCDISARSSSSSLRSLRHGVTEQVGVKTRYTKEISANQVS